MGSASSSSPFSSLIVPKTGHSAVEEWEEAHPSEHMGRRHPGHGEEVGVETCRKKVKRVKFVL